MKRFDSQANYLRYVIPAYAIICMSLLVGCDKQSSQPSSDMPTEAEQPNFLLILTDDQTVDTINALGNSTIHTPNIDQIAESGTSFTHVFNQGSWSGAVCAPSRRMINTGRHLYRTGYGPKKAEDDLHRAPLMGEVLQQAGYETFITGKWHIDNESIRRSFSLGSAIYEGGMSAKDKGGQFKPLVAEYDGNDDNPQNFMVHEGNKHSSELFIDAAIDYLDKKTSRNDNPFFMYVAFLAPHDPRQSPQEYMDMYPADAIPTPANMLPEHPFDEGDHLIRDEVLLPYPRIPETIKPFIGEYYAMITHMDAQIGRLLDQLEASEFAENTIIIFTSDHGLAVGQHGLLGKQNQYDHSARVPFIVSGPGIPENSIKSGMFYLHSVFPTVLDLAGIDIPESVDAQSIAPLLNGEQDSMHSSIYGAYKNFQRMVRTDKYKLIYYPVLNRTQLFDMQQDPLEMDDLSGDPANQQLVEELMAELEVLKQQVGDPLINSDPVDSFAPFFTPSIMRPRPELPQ
tara:strand:+ start:460 stop:1995 length:1536 start_codon:yes stop_codon:yes gene_type:complete